MSSRKYTCTLSPELLEKAKRELHEDPNTRHLEIKTLRERLEKVPGFKGRTDDAFILRFLRAKKFDQERAFSQINTYYRMRKELPDIYDNLTPQRVRHVMDACVTTVLKDRAPDGSRIVAFSIGKWDPDKCPVEDLIGDNFLTMSKLIEDEEVQVCGITFLIDMKNFGWQHAKPLMSSESARKSEGLLQESFPARFKGIHYIHEPSFFDVVFAVFKPFMKEKILKRIRLYGDKLEKLHESFSPEILPEDFGGKLPAMSVTSGEWKNTMLACEAQFVEDNKFGLVDLTIPGKESKKQDATESLGGTFRKLNVD